MELTDYWITKGSFESVAKTLSNSDTVNSAVLLNWDDIDNIVPFVVSYQNKDAFYQSFPWLVHIWETEGHAWGFEVLVNEIQIGQGLFGESVEWGVNRSQNGLQGELSAVASALGITSEQLKATLHDLGVEDFCKLLGHPFQELAYPRDIPDHGIYLATQMGEGD